MQITRTASLQLTDGSGSFVLTLYIGPVFNIELPSRRDNLPHYLLFELHLTQLVELLFTKRM